MYVDGVPVKAQNEQQSTEDRGQVETNAGGQINPLIVANDAIEEVSLITGGFAAEFGNAQSGMINIVTKEGGANLRRVQLCYRPGHAAEHGLRF